MLPWIDIAAPLAGGLSAAAASEGALLVSAFEGALLISTSEGVLLVSVGTAASDAGAATRFLAAEAATGQLAVSGSTESAAWGTGAVGKVAAPLPPLRRCLLPRLPVGLVAAFCPLACCLCSSYSAIISNVLRAKPPAVSVYGKISSVQVSAQK